MISNILTLSFCKAPAFLWLDESRCRLKGNSGCIWCHSYEHSYVYCRMQELCKNLKSK